MMDQELEEIYRNGNFDLLHRILCSIQPSSSFLQKLFERAILDKAYDVFLMLRQFNIKFYYLNTFQDYSSTDLLKLDRKTKGMVTSTFSFNIFEHLLDVATKEQLKNFLEQQNENFIRDYLSLGEMELITFEKLLKTLPNEIIPYQHEILNVFFDLALHSYRHHEFEEILNLVVQTTSPEAVSHVLSKIIDEEYSSTELLEKFEKCNIAI